METVCVQVLGTESYSDGDMTELPRVKFLVPSEWVSQLDGSTSVVLLPLCVDGTGTNASVEEDIIAAIDRLPAGERKLVTNLRARSYTSEAIMHELAMDMIVEQTFLHVMERENTRKGLQYHTEEWMLFSQKCKEIAQQEALSLAEKSPQAFVEKCKEVDLNVISTVFCPAGASVASPKTKADVCVVVSCFCHQ